MHSFKISVCFTSTLDSETILHRLLLVTTVLLSGFPESDVFGQSAAMEDPVPAEKALRVQTDADRQLSETETARLEELRQIVLDRDNAGRDRYAYSPKGGLYCPESYSMEFSPDGAALWTGVEKFCQHPSEFNMPRMWNLFTGQEIRRLGGHRGLYITSVGSSLQNHMVVSTGYTPTNEFGRTERMEVIVWDANTGEELVRLDSGHEAALTTDGEWLITAEHGSISGYRLKETLKQVTPIRTWQTEFHAGVVPALSLSPDNTLVAVAHSRKYVDEDPMIFIVEVKNGRIRGKLPAPTKYPASWSPDSRRVITHDKSAMTIWDVEKQREIRTFSEKDTIYLAEFDLTGNAAIAVMNRSQSVWTIKNGEKTQEQQMYHGGGKLCASPGRQFMITSADGKMEFVSLETGCTVAQLTQFDDERLWHVETIDGFFDASEELIKQDAEAISKSGLRHNPLKVRETLALLAPQREKQTLPNPSQDGRRLFVLSVGVSKHKHSEYDLKYAAVDAMSLTEALTTQGKTMYTEVFTEVYTDEKATLENLKKGLDWLGRSTTKDDVAVVFFSGHGIRGRNGLYFVPHDGDTEGIQYTCLNWTDVASAVSRTQSATTLFMTDCCHAGAIATSQRPSQEAMARLFQEKQGLFMYCSSAGDQVSRELSELGHGIFTHALLDGLRGAADKDKNGRTTIGELRTFVDDKVAQLTDQQQIPQTPLSNGFDDDTVILPVPNN